jgi:uncharacterized damage-inducible protein DinB
VVSAETQIAQIARYHAWATERLLKSVAPIPDASYRKSCGLFFGSIHGTLNHLLLTDSEIWYPMTTGQARVLPMSGALLHVFNHATHHRGQVTAAMSMLGFECQPLDLPYLIFSELA